MGKRRSGMGGGFHSVLPKPFTPPKDPPQVKTRKPTRYRFIARPVGDIPSDGRVSYPASAIFQRLTESSGLVYKYLQLRSVSAWGPSTVTGGKALSSHVQVTDNSTGITSVDHGTLTHPPRCGMRWSDTVDVDAHDSSHNRFAVRVWCDEDEDIWEDVLVELDVLAW